MLVATRVMSWVVENAHGVAVALLREPYCLLTAGLDEDALLIGDQVSAKREEGKLTRCHFQSGRGYLRGGHAVLQQRCTRFRADR